MQLYAPLMTRCHCHFRCWPPLGHCCVARMCAHSRPWVTQAAQGRQLHREIPPTGVVMMKLFTALRALVVRNWIDSLALAGAFLA